MDTFLCVVEAGSFSKAAEQLYISAPAVIKQINSLEASLGMKLFDRTHRGLVVTEAGQSIYNDAKYIIGYCKESVQRAKEAMQVSDDVIRVGISPMTPPQVFVDLWPQIQNLYPDIKFKLITFENTLENAREILANLGQNIDVVAGIFDETMLKLRGCDGTEISREPFCVAVSIHHRLAEKKKITLFHQIFRLQHRYSAPRFANISLAFSKVFSNVISLNFISGYRFWICGHRSTNTCGGVIGEIPTRITSSDTCIASFARCTDSLQYPMIYFASL